MKTDTENCMSADDWTQILEFAEQNRIGVQVDPSRPKAAIRHHSTHDPRRGNPEGMIHQSIECELSKTGYPMQKIRCQSSESSILLDGHVSRYYYLQIALQIALRFAGGRVIVNRIQVIDSPQCD